MNFNVQVIIKIKKKLDSICKILNQKHNDELLIYGE